MARNVLMQEDSDKICLDNANKFIDFRFNKLESDGYLETAEKCWSFLSDLHTSAICSACDPNVTNAFDLKSNRILLNDQALEGFKEKCMPMVNLN